MDIRFFPSDASEQGEIDINKHFALVFSMDEEAKTILIEDSEHYNKIYQS